MRYHTHALSILTLWVPLYPLAGLAKLATVVLSVTTAIVLFRLVPTLIALPGLRDMEVGNEKLRAEVAAHKETLAVLQKARDELEAKVEEWTAELRDVNARLLVTAREAVHRSHNLIAVITAMARQSARTHSDLGDYVETLTGRPSALADATGRVAHRGETTAIGLQEVVSRQLEPLLQASPDKIRIEIEAIDIDSEAAKQVSLAVHELATNMQKNGAREDAASSLVVEQETYQDADGAEWLKLLWHETSPTDANEVTRKSGGFGTRLLAQIIPSMFNGKVTRELANGSLTYELNVPMSQIRPDAGRHALECLVAGVLDRNFSAA